VPPSTSETLRNSDFESSADGSPTDWLRYGGTLSSASSPTHTGSGAARFESASDSTKWIYEVVSIQGGAPYSFDAWVLDDDPAVKSAFLRVSWYASDDGSGSALSAADSGSRLDAPSPDFRRLTTGSVAAPATAHSARLRIMLAPVSGDPAAIYVDDAEFLHADPEAAAAAPVRSAPDAAPGEPITEDAPSSAASAPHSASGIASGLAAGPSTGVVINEVLYDADSSGSGAEGEWVEIYNGGDVPVSLRGWRLSDGSASSNALPDVVISAQSFAVIAASDSFRDAYPGYVGIVVALNGRIGNSLGNDGDSLALSDAAGNLVDALSWGTDSRVFVPPIRDVPAGHSMERRVPGRDTNTATDFTDNNSPSPGRPFAPATAVGNPKQQTQAGRASIDVLPAGDGSSRALLLVALAGASVALVAGVGWRAFPLVSQRLRHHA
jgi:hypothetical protein